MLNFKISKMSNTSTQNIRELAKCYVQSIKWGGVHGGQFATVCWISYGGMIKITETIRGLPKNVR